MQRERHRERETERQRERDRERERESDVLWPLLDRMLIADQVNLKSKRGSLLTYQVNPIYDTCPSPPFD